MFQPHELVNNNCTGTRGKVLLDQVKLGLVREYVFKLDPYVRAMEDMQVKLGLVREYVFKLDPYVRAMEDMQ